MDKLVARINMIQDSDLKEELLQLVELSLQLNADLNLLLSEVHTEYKNGELDGIPKTLSSFCDFKTSHQTNDNRKLDEIEFMVY